MNWLHDKVLKVQFVGDVCFRYYQLAKFQHDHANPGAQGMDSKDDKWNDQRE